MEAPEDGRLAAIVAEARATRPRPSRLMWVAALIVGAVCAIGFVLLLVPYGEPVREVPAETEAPPGGAAGAGGAGKPAPPRASRRGAAGCLGGFGLGLGLGLAIGYVLARRHAGDHSSRSRP